MASFGLKIRFPKLAEPFSRGPVGPPKMEGNSAVFQIV
jgi:hypothetical protein